MKATTRQKRSTQANPFMATAAYLELVRDHPLIPIEDDAALDRAIERLDEVLDDHRADDDPQVQGYILVLGDLIEAYETEHIPEPGPDPAGMLLHMIDAKGTSLEAVAAATGLAKSTVSQIAAGRRKPSRRSIAALSKHFDVDPGLFE